MKKLDIEELRQVQLGILSEFDKICRENNLRYSAGGGTLLGAVRHKGYIPWDDDIDVNMPRADYEKLLSLKINNDNFEIKSHRYSKGYYYPFAKMMDKRTLIVEKNRPEKDMGVYIDIFPFDSVEERNEKFERDMKKELKMRKFLDHFTADANFRYSHSYKDLLKKIVHFFTDPFRKPLLNHVDKKHFNTEGKYCVNFVYNFRGSRTLMEAKIWDEIIYMDFEDIKIAAYKNYDAYLGALYRDYMTLPPVEKQVIHHSFEAYYKS